MGSLVLMRGLCKGIFYSLRKHSERLDVKDFDTNAKADLSLQDIDTEVITDKGFWFSWSNKRGDIGNIKSRIDSMVNSKW